MSMEMRTGLRPVVRGEEVDVEDGGPIGLPGESTSAAVDDDEAAGEDQAPRDGGLKATIAGFLARFDKKTSPVANDDSVKADEAQTSEGPTEGEGIAVPDDEAASAAKRKRQRQRQMLIGGVSAVAVLVVATAGAMFWPASVKRAVLAEPGMANHPSLLAPAASLASVPKPEIQAPVAQTRVKGRDPMQELLALKPADPADPPKPQQAEKAAQPAPQAQAPNVAVADAGAEKPKPDDQTAKTIAAVADSTPAKPAAERASVVGDASSAGPKEPVVDAVVASKPAPEVAVKAAPAQKDAAQAKEPDRLETVRKETALLDRLTQMAALVTHLSGQVNRLESEQAKLAATSEERHADLLRRMAMAESNRQIDAATRAQDPHNSATPPAPPKEAKPPVVLKTGPGAAAVVEASGGKRAYLIQAASPTLAMLGTGGNEAPIEVVPGSTIPGWGRVSKIEQRGQAWVVVTSGGVIK